MTTTRQAGPGWSWSDAALWIGVLVGIPLLGLLGDRAVGALIFGAAAVGAGATRITRRRPEAGSFLRRAGGPPRRNPAPAGSTTAEPLP